MRRGGTPVGLILFTFKPSATSFTVESSADRDYGPRTVDFSRLDYLALHRFTIAVVAFILGSIAREQRSQGRGRAQQIAGFLTITLLASRFSVERSLLLVSVVIGRRPLPSSRS